MIPQIPKPLFTNSRNMSKSCSIVFYVLREIQVRLRLAPSDQPGKHSAVRLVPARELIADVHVLRVRLDALQERRFQEIACTDVEHKRHQGIELVLVHIRAFPVHHLLKLPKVLRQQLFRLPGVDPVAAPHAGGMAVTDRPDAGRAAVSLAAEAFELLDQVDACMAGPHEIAEFASSTYALPSHIKVVTLEAAQLAPPTVDTAVPSLRIINSDPACTFVSTSIVSAAVEATATIAGLASCTIPVSDTSRFTATGNGIVTIRSPSSL